MKKNKILLILVSACSITACSGEPSDKDIETALNSLFEQSNQQMQQVAESFGVKEAAQGMAATLHSSKKLACTEAIDAAGYVCDVEVDSTAPLVGRTSVKQSMRFVEVDGSWQVLN